ncbi:MAG TPA: GNAT family N-acetyltransferase [Rhodospirillales bacterium]|nr:GNAT family N-acetyltransferase [Rhodospirillales bacterium]
MTDKPDLVIEPLGKKHNRAAFSCGTDELDTYLQRQASQDTKRRIARIFVIRSAADDQTILGYYTLSALSIDLSSLPSDLAKKLPKHPLPAALIGRLAVSTKSQGTGIGKVLLADAIKRTLALSDEIGVYAMVVDALNTDAEAFYQGFGFSKLNAATNRLFLPLKSV